jgi:ankyrin repeat protein
MHLLATWGGDPSGGHLDSARWLHGSVDPGLIHLRSNLGHTPFHFACFKGCEAAARWLVAAGAEARAVDARGWTALHVAAEAGRYDICRWLLDQPLGTDLLAPNGMGLTAQALAAGARQGRAARLLQVGRCPSPSRFRP